jgi:23S rRNA (cytosine1962-C5)-methyltransferase
MRNTESSSRRGVIRKLFPVIWQDEQYLAIAKPPRLDLERSIARRGVTYIQAAAAALGAAPDNAPPFVPLVLPEHFASGVALFGRNEDARARFAASAEAHRLQFSQVVIAQGRPPRERIAVKPGLIKAAAKPGREPKHLPPPARLEVLDSNRELHVVRCTSPSAGLEDLRRCLKVGGMTIVGDIRPSAYAATREPTPGKRPLIHFERVVFRHPDGRNEINLVAPAPREFFQYLALPQMIDEHLHSALAARLQLLIDEGTDAYRLFTGRPEGVSGLLADKLGDILILETQQGKFQGREPQLRQVANWYGRILGLNTVYARKAPKERSSLGPQPEDREELIELLKGDEVEETTIVENGMRFIVRPRGLHVGLYLDQRDNRRRIRQLAEGRDVLNLFAYTCGFSVAAAFGKAQSTTSVDLSVANLEWGKRNFAANDLDLTSHRFIHSDAFGYFERAARQKQTYDLIVIDPPSFARLKKPKRTFEVKKHLVELLTGALTLLRPKGVMLISTNSRHLIHRWLVEQVEQAAEDRAFKVLAKPALPVDYAADPQVQKSILVEFE